MSTLVDYEVCGLVILTRPEHQCQVKRQLLSTKGVDIHAQNHTGTFAITIEAISNTNHFLDKNLPHKSLLEKIAELQNTPEIIDVAFVYGQQDRVG